jgi:hypothetical protein
MGVPVTVSPEPCQVIWVPLVEITGEHRIVEELNRELELPYGSSPRQECIPKGVVHNLLERMPILIHREKDRVLCVGNIRLFRLARVVLDPSESVPTLEYKGNLSKERRERLREGLLIEAFLLPAIFGQRTSELQALSVGWERAEKAQMLKFWSGGSCAGLYGEDPLPHPRKRASPIG